MTETDDPDAPEAQRLSIVMPTTPQGCTLRIVGFDFDTKVERELEPRAVAEAFERGMFVWIDVDFTEPEGTRLALATLGLVAPEIVEDALSHQAATQIARYDDYLHFVVSGCRLVGQKFDLERVDCAISTRFLLTIHKGPVLFLDAMRKDYKQDFQRFARSPSFLVYEIWDHLVENYLRVQHMFEGRVESVQAQLTGEEVNDGVFAQVSDLGSDLLHFRKVVLPARAVLTDLSTRKSLFVGEATQVYLANMVGTLERVMQDLLVDRDILSESLNLYMSMVTHRTNAVMKKLTVVSVVFLPLSFLCGVYGTNFQNVPELQWRYGYAMFWAAVAVIVGGVVWLSRRARLL